MLLYSFTGKADGAIAAGGVVEDAAGNLYGETESAGGSVCTSKLGSPNLGCGTVYRLSLSPGCSVSLTHLWVQTEHHLMSAASVRMGRRMETLDFFFR